MYRYGGELQLVRNLPDKEKGDDRGANFHLSLGDMVQQLTRSREAAVMSRNHEDQKLLDSLESYIKNSDIVKVAGPDLLPHWFAKTLGPTRISG
jgi:hypothetical protein